MEAADVPNARSPLPAGLAARIPRPAWTTDAWMSIAVTALFVAITSWWLTQDRSIPIFDAGLHLSLTTAVYEHLRSGSIGTALTLSVPYPPFSYLVGALGILIGGVGVAQPIVAQNLVFVPLLALGCYHVGRLAFSPRVGLLAVVFALGSPLIMAQFHVTMIDAPETAMVAVSLWAIIATEGFLRLGVSALAGLVVGLGMLTKEPFAFFVIGVLGVTVLRGGWQAWRGLLVFTVVASAVALPWYVHEFSQVHALGTGALNTANQAEYRGDIAPGRLSIENLTWYFWNFINYQLLLPLFLFATVGVMWLMLGFVRRRPISRLAPELALGALVSWLGITETFTHDTRYSMPLLVYLAVLGSGWIARLRRPGRRLATTALVLVATANTLGTSFGIGRSLQVSLPGATSSSRQKPGLLTLYSNEGFLVGGPKRDGDILGLMQALRRNGVREVAWLNLGPEEPRPTFTPDFSRGGLTAFAQIAKLTFLRETVVMSNLTQHDAVLGHGPIEAGEAPPCAKLSDGTGVWVRLGGPNRPGVMCYCPFRHPVFY
jgi:4-amino-4-deoxy-L-arabinose transferase-like glycosyltransferase